MGPVTMNPCDGGFKHNTALKFLILHQKLATQKFRRKLIFKNFQRCIALKIVVGNLAV